MRRREQLDQRWPSTPILDLVVNTTAALGMFVAGYAILALGIDRNNGWAQLRRDIGWGFGLLILCAAAAATRVIVRRSRRW